MKTILNIFKKDYIFFILLFFLSFILIYLLNKELVDFYLMNNYVGGWDGAGHFSIGKIYSENIFPAFWGWIPNWYNGMPFPQFYPPLFYYTLALLNNITNIEYQAVFKYFLIFLATIVPVLLSIAYYYRVSKNKIQSFFVLIVSCLFLSTRSTIGHIGISLPGLLNNGLVTQPFAFVFLILWLFFFVELNKNKLNKYLAGFFLFLTFLSNAHVVFVCFFIFINVFIIDIYKNFNGFNKKLKNKIGLYFFSGLMPLLAASFWYIPMIYYYDFSTSTALVFSWLRDLNLVFDHPYVGFSLIIGLIFIKKINSNIILATLSINIFFIALTILRVNKLFPDLPIHADRWIGTTFFLTPLLLVYVLSILKNMSRKIIFYILLYIFILLSLYGFYSSNVTSVELRGIYEDTPYYSISEILKYFENKEGLIMVEVDNPKMTPADKVLNSYLGAQGNTTTYTIIRESSISSLSYTPIRNSLSGVPECWGIRCNISFNEDYLARDFDEHLETARRYGVEYFVIRSRGKKDLFDKNKSVQLVHQTESWNVYQTKEKGRQIIYPERDPIFVFSKLNTKRETEKTGYMSLVENINIRLGHTDVVFAHKNIDYIEDLATLSDFKYIFLNDYRYKNPDIARKAIDAIIETTTLFVVPTTDKKNEIYNYIEMIGRNHNNIVFIENMIFENTPAYKKTLVIDNIVYEAKKPDYYEILYQTLTEIVPKTNKYDLEGELLDSDNNLLVAKIINNNENKPLIINKSYFPEWRSLGTEVYMVSPTSMLLFSNKNIESIYFDTPKIVVLAHYLSLLAIFGIFIVLFSERKK